MRRKINHAFADLGKVIASYVETLVHRPSRFDSYVGAIIAGSQEYNSVLSGEELAGLRLFIDSDKTPCLRCHNSPLFTNHEFHNIGTGIGTGGTTDWGRFLGLRAAMIDEFNCLGPYSDASPDNCDHLAFVTDGHLDHGAFKVPSLRNSSMTAPYMHDGRFDDLEQVVRNYLMLGRHPGDSHEVPRFSLTDNEIAQLVAFLSTLATEE